MTIEKDEAAEKGLSALFEQTGSALSDVERVRLEARAVAIAERKASERRLRRAAWPLALAAAGAAAYLGVAPPRETASRPASPAGSPSVASVAPSAAPLPTAVARPEPPESDEAAALFRDIDADGPFDLGDLMDDEEAR